MLHVLLAYCVVEVTFVFSLCRPYNLVIFFSDVYLPFVIV